MKDFIRFTYPLAKALDEVFAESDLEKRFDSLFGLSKTPRVNIQKSEKNYKIDVFCPGMRKDDFQLDIEKNIMTISSKAEEKNEKEDDGMIFKEYYHTDFSRSFRLPENAEKEKIFAKYENGVLSINIPKKEEPEKENKKNIIIQ